MPRKTLAQRAAKEPAPEDDDDVVTGEIVEEGQATEAEARARVDRIRATLDFAWREIKPDLIAAYIGKDWIPLGHAGFGEYMAAEYGTRLPRFESIEERTDTIEELVSAGLSQRAAGAATGTSGATVNRTLNPPTSVSSETSATDEHVFDHDELLRYGATEEQTEDAAWLAVLHDIVTEKALPPRGYNKMLFQAAIQEASKRGTLRQAKSGKRYPGGLSASNGLTFDPYELAICKATEKECWDVDFISMLGEVCREEELPSRTQDVPSVEARMADAIVDARTRLRQSKIASKRATGDGDLAGELDMKEAQRYVLTELDRTQFSRHSARAITSLQKGYHGGTWTVVDGVRKQVDAPWIIQRVLDSFGDQVVLEHRDYPGVDEVVRLAEPLDHTNERSNPPGLFVDGEFIESAYRKPVRENYPPVTQAASLLEAGRKKNLAVNDVAGLDATDCADLEKTLTDAEDALADVRDYFDYLRRDEAVPASPTPGECTARVQGRECRNSVRPGDGQCWSHLPKDVKAARNAVRAEDSTAENELRNVEVYLALLAKRLNSGISQPVRDIIISDLESDIGTARTLIRKLRNGTRAPEAAPTSGTAELIQPGRPTSPHQSWLPERGLVDLMIMLPSAITESYVQLSLVCPV